MAIARSFGKWYGIFPPYRLEAWDKRGKWRAYGKAGGGDYAVSYTHLTLPTILLV